jgi:U4/U6.U5 tri-snRNP-associated protein 1
LDLDALEAAAAAEGGADLGSRGTREQRRKQQQDAAAAAAADRTARFDAALSRANVASESLRPNAAAAAGSSGFDLGDDDADDELAASLARARRVAAVKGSSGSNDVAADAGADGGGSSLAGLARELALKREQDEEELKQQLASGGCAVDRGTACVRMLAH